MLLWRSLGCSAVCHNSVFTQLSLSPVYIDTKQPHAPLHEIFQPKDLNVLETFVRSKARWFNVSDKHSSFVMSACRHLL